MATEYQRTETETRQRVELALKRMFDEVNGLAGVEHMKAAVMAFGFAALTRAVVELTDTVRLSDAPFHFLVCTECKHAEEIQARTRDEAIQKVGWRQIVDGADPAQTWLYCPRCTKEQAA